MILSQIKMLYPPPYVDFKHFSIATMLFLSYSWQIFFHYENGRYYSSWRVIKISYMFLCSTHPGTCQQFITLLSLRKQDLDYMKHSNSLEFKLNGLWPINLHIRLSQTNTFYLNTSSTARIYYNNKPVKSLNLYTVVIVSSSMGIELIAIAIGSSLAQTLIHYGRVTHICVSKLCHNWFRKWMVAFLFRCQNNARLLSIWPQGTHFNEISIQIQTFSFTKMHFKMLFDKSGSFCLGLNVLKMTYRRPFYLHISTTIVAWINNDIDGFLWSIFAHPFHNSKGALAELKFFYEQVITSHNSYVHNIIYRCP